MTRLDNTRVIRAATRHRAHRKSWLTEAPLRMLMNNLDPDVAERPEELVVYGGIGRAARDWESFDKIVETLRRLDDDETLLVQSGKPVGVFRTHADAPRVLIANSNLVPHWATWDHFNELDRKGLAMYGQMTAGSLDLHRQPGHRAGHLRDLRRDGPPALRRRPVRHVDPDRRPRRHGRRPAAGGDDGRRLVPGHRMPASRIEMRLRTGYLDAQADDLDEALAWIEQAMPRQGKPISVGLLGNAAEILPELVAARRAARPGHRPDLAPTTRSTATCPPAGPWSEWDAPARAAIPKQVEEAARSLDGRARPGHARLPAAGHADLRLRQQHPPDGQGRGRRQRLRLPGLRAGLHPPAVLPRRRPVPLGGAVGRSGGHLQDRRQGEGTDPGQRRTCTTGWTWPRERISFQGLPARICWVGLGDRHAWAWPSTRWSPRAS